MREIDLESWARRDHFQRFVDYHHPHFDMCADVDVTELRTAVKEREESLTIAIVYAIARAANDIRAFRWRIRGDTVVEHDVIHPTATILVSEDLFSFCFFHYDSSFTAFAEDAARRITLVKEQPTLSDPVDRDDWLFMTAIPWVAFTSFSHPMSTAPPDSVPYVAWGRVHEREGRLVMPLEVQGHHALMDGIHLGRFYGRIQRLFDQPDELLDS